MDSDRVAASLLSCWKDPEGLSLARPLTFLCPFFPTLPREFEYENIMKMEVTFHILKSCVLLYGAS